MEYGTAEYNLRLREVQALEKIAKSLELISMSKASNNIPPFYCISDPQDPNNVYNVLNTFPRDIHITSEGNDEDGSKA